MPQLDPSPWFFILLSSWTILILFAPIKLLKFLNLNNPSLKHHKSFKNSWFWPWP